MPQFPTFAEIAFCTKGIPSNTPDSPCTPESNSIIAVAELYSFGYEVFEDKDKFNKWMFATNQALGGATPFDFMDNQFGREEIRNLIGRIAYGVFS